MQKLFIRIGTLPRAIGRAVPLVPAGHVLIFTVLLQGQLCKPVSSRAVIHALLLSGRGDHPWLVLRQSFSTMA